MTGKNEKTFFFITVRQTFRGIQLPLRDTKAAAKGWEKAGIAQLLDESFYLSPEDPFEEIEGSIEIS